MKPFQRVFIAMPGWTSRCDQFAGAIDLTIDVHERAQLRDEAGRPEGPPGAGRRFAVADLRHESRLGAEAVSRRP